ncbi:MAG: outer membrane beta-barrel protein [Desulforhopalus sp.]
MKRQLFVFIMLLMAGPVWAGSSNLDSKPYLRVGLGAASLQESSGQLTDLGSSIDQLDFASETVFWGELEAGATVFKGIAPALRIKAAIDQELGDIYTNEDGATYAFDLSVDSYLFALDLNVDIAEILDKEWPVRPFVGATVGAVYHDVSELTFPSSTESLDSASNWDFAWGVSAGVRYFLGSNIAVDLTYRYEDMGEAELSDLALIAGSIDGTLPNTAKAEIHTHSIGVGLAYYF